MVSSRASRSKALLSGAVTVALLALVLIGLGLFGPWRDRSPSQKSSQVGQTVSGATLYQQALDAESSGDLTRTAVLAQSAVDADPSNADAKALLLRVNTARSSGSTPTTTSPAGSRPATNAVDPNAAFLKKYKNLASLLPTRQAGYAFDYPAQVGRDISVSGNVLPSKKGLSQIAWSVHDLGKVAAATAFRGKVSERLFSKNSASTSIHGASAYFGTDGTRFATVSFARGRYAFEVIVTVEGVPPKSFKTIALDAAKAFPFSLAR